MQEELFKIIFEKWRQKELSYHKVGKRKYLHFDDKFPFPSRVPFFKNYLQSSEKNVPRHSFYPFVKHDIVTQRLKTEKINGKKKVFYKDKIRPIAYASHFDSYLYSWYSSVLTHMYELKLGNWGIRDCVKAYLQTGMCNIHFAKEVFDYIVDKGECAVLAFDISSFFDGLDHDLLKRMWGKVIGSERLPKDHWSVFKTLTDYSYVEKTDVEMVFPWLQNKEVKFERFCSTEQFRKYIRGEKLIQKNTFYNKVCDSIYFGKQCGIPQGSSISACLSNIYMIEFDQAINGLARNSKSLYRRYCDDIIVVCPKEQRDLMVDIVQSELKRNQLVVNPLKTEISHFSYVDGKLGCFHINGGKSHIQYLGFEFDGQNAFIRSSSLSRYARRINLKVDKAINDAYNYRKGKEEVKIYRKGLYKALTNLGSRNFISYANRAGEEIFKSDSIKKQYKGSIKKVEKVIKKKVSKQEVKNNKKDSD